MKCQGRSVCFMIAVACLVVMAIPAAAQNGGESATRAARGGATTSGLKPVPNDSFHVTFSGSFSYSVGSGKARMQVQDIVNSGTATSGPLHLILVFTPNGPFPNTGFQFTAQYDLAPLAVGQHYTNVDSGQITFNDPGNGCWYTAIVLYEQRTDGAYIADDWGNFSLRLSSGQGCMYSFTGSPLTISPGQSSTLTWSTGGNSATLDQGIGVKPPSGSVSVSPTVTTTYTCQATGTADATPRSAQVTITVGQPAPTVNTFTATPSTITAGQSSTLAWTTTNASSVTISGVPGTQPANGSVSVTPSSTTTYTLTATGTGGTATRSAIVTVNPAPPVITGISPNHGRASGGNLVTIGGTGLTGASSVTFGGAAATLGANNGTSLTVTAPSHAAGSVTVQVTTPGGSATTSYTYDAANAPSITSLSPSSGPTTGGQTVTISGANFGSGNTVAFGGVAATILTGTATSISVKTPPHAAGTVSVTVTMSSGVASADYTYVDSMRIVSVVGSTAGSFGSFFRTAVQMHNNGTVPLSGTMTFHPTGSSGGTNDPSLPFSLTAGQTKSIDDLVAALNASGVGSLDINSDAPDALLFSSRIYNDAGSAGTTGMSIDPLAPSDALQQGDTALLLVPATAGARFNVGVRSLGAGATLQVALYNADGTLHTATSHTYDPNVFSQTGASDFAGAAPNPNETIVITLSGGSAIVYGAMTDNNTQDPTYQPAKSLASLAARGQVAKLVIPVVGSVAGSFGSFFRTSLQVHNAGAAPISGSMIFHPQAAAASPSDRSLPYSIQPGQTIAYSDIVALIGTSGIGSLDVTSTDFRSLLLLARIYNDAGAKGTTGMGLDAMAPADALQPGDTGVLLAPAHTDVFRYNIGVRTLDGGASLQFTVIDSNGATKATASKTFDPNFFQQYGAADLLGTAISANDAILITVNSGAVIVYGSTTDNRTQDPTYATARRR